MRIELLFISTALALSACGGKGDDTSDSGSSGGPGSSSTSASSSSSATDATGSTSATGSGGASEGTSGATTGAASSTSLTTDATDATTTATTDATTGGPPDGACRKQEDCDPNGGEICFAPDESNCGACQLPDMPCMVDDDCGPEAVCAPFEAQCACNPGENNCVPVTPCTMDAQCAPEERCDGNICVHKTCSLDGLACPPFFDCVPGTGGDECQRIPCATDGDCGDGGFCVKGRCFDGLGMCQLPAP